MAGGSPNALSTVDFLRLIEHLTARFAIVDPVYSIELDPRAMTADWADEIGSVGIQRASLGVQTFAAHCQQAIGRVQSEDRRTADDRIRGRVIEQLLCHGRSAMPPDLIEAARCSLAPFTDRGLASIDGVHLNILPDGLPYARTIAALFDHYRHPLSDRFSSAV